MSSYNNNPLRLQRCASRPAALINNNQSMCHQLCSGFQPDPELEPAGPLASVSGGQTVVLLARSPGT